MTSLGYAYPDGIADGGIEVTNARCGVRGIDRDQADHATFQVVGDRRQRRQHHELA